jgi:serine O-acetyltransferase
MSLNKWLESAMDGIVQRLGDAQAAIDELTPGRSFIVSERQNVVSMLDRLIAIVIPGFRGYDHGVAPDHDLETQVAAAAPLLHELVRKALDYASEARGETSPGDTSCTAVEVVRHVFESLPALKEHLRRDMVAAYEGDPAALSIMEVIVSYPCILAIVTYRLAHLLYEKSVPLIPRMMTELAHSRTGIDIHPGARIGPGFFIDHGTGVVIGETCEIGENVKLYQGVTLGALSFPKDGNGRLIKGIKRHPRVESNVTIYAGATILGGETVIGAGSEIGGNVWLTHTVPAGSKVHNQQPDPLIKAVAKDP